MYPTSIDEDKALLDSEDLSQNQRACITFRKGEKEVLKWVNDLAQHLIKIISMTQKEAKVYFNTNIAQFDDYFKEDIITML